MVKLLGRALGKQQKQHTNGAQETVAPIQEQPRDRILVLVPGEGGFAFRLLAFPSIEHAASYGFEHYPQRVHQLYSFRPHHDRPRDLPPGTPGQIEAIVMVRDEQRHGTVHLYSFVDMDTAHAFVRAEGMRGLNLRLVLVFWAEPVQLYNAPEEQAPQAQEPSGPPPVVLTQWQQPANPVFDSMRGEQQPPAFAEDDVTQPAPAFEQSYATEASGPAPRFTEPPREPLPAAPSPTEFAPPPPVEAPPPPPMAPQASQQAPAPVFDVFAPPPAAPPPTNGAHGAGFATDRKEPRRWNINEDFPEPAANPARAAAAGAPVKGGIIHRIRSWPGWDGFGPVIVGAALLRWETYDEVRKDPYAAGRAKVLVGASIGASALSAALSGILVGAGFMPDLFAFFFFTLFGAIGAAAYAGCIYGIGTQLFGGRAERNDMRLFLQRLGLAAAPGLLLILGLVPVFGPMFVLAALIWVMITSIKAVEIALELDRQSAAFTAIISWLALFAIGIVMPMLAT